MTQIPLFKITDVLNMSPEEWHIKQPFYKQLASMDYFTYGLPYEDFETSLNRVLQLEDPYQPFCENILSKKEIINEFSFTVHPTSMYIHMVGVSLKGLWAVLWRVILILCQKYNIKRISLMDRSFLWDVWTHYGFSGQLHDDSRVFYLN